MKKFFVLWYISGAAIFLLFATAFFSRDLMNLENQKPVELPGAESTTPPPANS